MEHANQDMALAQQHQSEIDLMQEDEETSAIVLNNPVTLTNILLQSDAATIVHNIVEAVDEGVVDALKALAAIKKLESIADVATNKDPKKNKHADLALLLQTHVSDASQKQPEKKFSMYGATFTKTEAGTKYDWSKCEDPQLVMLEQAAKKATDALKERQEFLKNLPDGGMIVTDEETGETSRIYRPAKSSTSTVSVSFK